MPGRWFVYLLRCADDSLYCGVTNDLDKRLESHRRGTGARYTRGRSPLTLVHKERAKDRGDAQRKEAAWKRLSRTEKLARMAKVEAQRSRRRRAGLPAATA